MACHGSLAPLTSLLNLWQCMGRICVSVLQASLASLASFVVGAGVPLVAALFSDDQHVRLACVLVRASAPAMAPCTCITIVFLLQLGAMWTMHSLKLSELQSVL